MIDRKTLLVGTDAEIPIRLVTGEFFPVTGLIGGTKAEPRPLRKLGDGFYVQEDNVNLEFNTPPAKTPEEFQKNVKKTILHLSSMLPPTMELCIVGHAEYNPKFLRDSRLSEFGCVPDYNVYTQAENPKPKAKNPNLRSASAHIHVGWNNPTDEDRDALVKLLDLTIGLRWIGLDDMKRKELYGKAGTFRPKDYGLEYRVLDNCWLDFESGRPATVFSQVEEAVNLLNSGERLPQEFEEELRLAINTGSTKRLSKKFSDWCSKRRFWW